MLRESGREVATFHCKTKKLRAPVWIEVASVDRRFFFVIDREVIFSCDLEAQPAQPIAHATKVSTESADLSDERLDDSRQDTDEAIVRRADVLGRVWRWR